MSYLISDLSNNEFPNCYLDHLSFENSDGILVEHWRLFLHPDVVPIGTSDYADSLGFAEFHDAYLLQAIIEFGLKNDSNTILKDITGNNTESSTCIFHLSNKAALIALADYIENTIIKENTLFPLMAKFSESEDSVDFKLTDIENSDEIDVDWIINFNLDDFVANLREKMKNTEGV